MHGELNTSQSPRAKNLIQENASKRVITNTFAPPPHQNLVGHFVKTENKFLSKSRSMLGQFIGWTDVSSSPGNNGLRECINRTLPYFSSNLLTTKHSFVCVVKKLEIDALTTSSSSSSLLS